MKKKECYIPIDLLSDGSFRNKIDIIMLCIKYVKQLPYAEKSENNNPINTLLFIDKMKRLFIEVEGSIHSIQFPFDVIEEEKNKYKFYCMNCLLDSKITSLLLEFFNQFNDSGTLEDMYEIYLHMIDEYELKNDGCENLLWNIINHLFTFEASYLRYDEDFSERTNKNHPPYHLDINYSNASTFKIGLEHKILWDDYIDILDNNKRCKILKM